VAYGEEIRIPQSGQILHQPLRELGVFHSTFVCHPNVLHPQWLHEGQFINLLACGSFQIGDAIQEGRSSIQACSRSIQMNIDQEYERMIQDGCLE
jgi:hypothetical protein